MKTHKLKVNSEGVRFVYDDKLRTELPELFNSASVQRVSRIEPVTVPTFLERFSPRVLWSVDYCVELATRSRLSKQNGVCFVIHWCGPMKGKPSVYYDANFQPLRSYTGAVEREVELLQQLI